MERIANVVERNHAPTLVSLRRAFQLAVVVLALLLPTAARAEESPAKGEWYGWQTLTADGLTIAVGATAVAAWSETGRNLLIGSGITYLVASPVIHVVHRQPAAAAGSFALRVLVPPLASIAGLAVSAILYDGALFSHGGRGETAALVGMGTGFGLGVVGTSVIDALLLAREPAPKPTTSARLVPSFDRNGASLTLGGTF